MSDCGFPRQLYQNIKSKRQLHLPLSLYGGDAYNIPVRFLIYDLLNK